MLPAFEIVVQEWDHHVSWQEFAPLKDDGTSNRCKSKIQTFEAMLGTFKCFLMPQNFNFLFLAGRVEIWISEFDK